MWFWLFLFLWMLVGLIIAFLVCNFCRRFELFPTGCPWWREVLTTLLLGPLFWLLGLISIASHLAKR
jgi:hypothetical protein